MRKVLEAQTRIRHPSSLYLGAYFYGRNGLDSFISIICQHSAVCATIGGRPDLGRNWQEESPKGGDGYLS